MQIKGIYVGPNGHCVQTEIKRKREDKNTAAKRGWKTSFF